MPNNSEQPERVHVAFPKLQQNQEKIIQWLWKSVWKSELAVEQNSLYPTEEDQSQC